MNTNFGDRNWNRFYRLNNYYHENIHRLVKHLIPPDASVLEIGSRGGELISALPNFNKVGIEFDSNLVRYAKLKNKRIKIFTLKDFTGKYKNYKFDYLILSDVLSETEDILSLINKIKKNLHQDSRVIVIYFSFFWKLFLDFAERLHLKYPKKNEPNWLSPEDMDNFFYLENFERIKFGRRFLIPYKIPLFSNLVNKFISPLPGINLLSLTSYSVYKMNPKFQNYSVSIIVPARNEAGNMRTILKRIPKIGNQTEVVFVEGHSKDNTYQTILEQINKYKGPLKVKLFKQKGVGKGDAVRLGFSKASNELLMILDADLTVSPKELRKFYRAAAFGYGDLIMGSRLIYPMEKQAMRTLNLIGNKFFSLAFSFLLNQRIKDTLCGTKVLLKKNYEKIERNRNYFGDFDPFGDFDLIFGAAKLNLKITEIPVRYKERVYGTTNISRFSHGFLLLRMVNFAARKIKFI